MICQLPPVDHEKARPVFSPLDEHLAVNAIIESTVQGTIYANDRDYPSAALAWAGKRFFLAGNPKDESFVEHLRMLFGEVIYPRAQEAGALMFVLYYAPGWERAIEHILEGKHPIRDRREYWEFRTLRHDWRTRLPPGCELRTVDRALFADAHLEHIEDLEEEICSEGGTVEEFLRHSFGICLVQDDAEIVSWCLSEYDSRDRCEVGVETAPGHRRQGLATIAASALVEKALAQGKRRIGWHCWASNVASGATARKVGFEKVADYSVYFAWFNEVDNLAVNGNICLRDGDARAAVEWYRRAFFHGEAKGWAYWNAAEAYTRLGEPEQALAALRQALERGYGNRQALEQAAEFVPLHGTPSWQALLEEAGRKAH